MNTNVNLILVRYLFQALIKILHVFYQERPRKSEVSLLIFTVVNYVNHYRVFKVSALNV